MLEEDFGWAIEMKIGIKNRRSDKLKQRWPLSLKVDLLQDRIYSQKNENGMSLKYHLLCLHANHIKIQVLVQKAFGTTFRLKASVIP